MKRALLILALCVGCTTVELTPEQKVQRRLTRIESITRGVIYIGARRDIKAHPGHREYYAQSLAGLTQLQSEPTLTPQSFSDALIVTGNEKFSDENAVLVLTIVPELLDLATGSQINLNEPANLRAALKGAIGGLTLALK